MELLKYDFEDAGDFVETCDGYPSIRLRNSFCWNMKMLFYVLFCDLATMISFTLYQMEVSVAFISFLPALLNIWVLTLNSDTKKKLFTYSN